MTAEATMVGASANPFAATVPGTADGLRILCVDDNPVCRRFLEVVLTRDGHIVTCAEDGQHALDRIAGDADAYDLVITDHHMPRVDGFQLVQTLKRWEFAGAIIVISAGLDDATAARYRALAVSAILLKPVLVDRLRSTINRYRRR
jgi:CheY-like chemotaxis protein